MLPISSPMSLTGNIQKAGKSMKMTVQDLPKKGMTGNKEFLNYFVKGN